MLKLGNTVRFLRLLITEPGEFLDRAQVYYQAEKKRFSRKPPTNLYSDPKNLPDGLKRLSEIFKRDIAEILSEKEFRATETHILGLTQQLRSAEKLPFPIIFNADPSMGQLAYALTRVLQPDVVLETGVAYGITSAMILAALHRNNKGMLHSIDLPPIAARATSGYIGMMIPPEHKSRWTLHVGASKRILPALLKDSLGSVGLFIHDSATIYSVQKLEMEAVWPWLSDYAAMIIDDVGRSNALAEFILSRRPDHWLVVEEKEKEGVLLGVVVKNSDARVSPR